MINKTAVPHIKANANSFRNCAREIATKPTVLKATRGEKYAAPKKTSTTLIVVTAPASKVNRVIMALTQFYIIK